MDQNGQPGDERLSQADVLLLLRSQVFETGFEATVTLDTEEALEVGGESVDRLTVLWEDAPVSVRRK